MGNHIDSATSQQAQDMAQILMEAMTIANTALSSAKRQKHKYVDLANNGTLAIIEHQAKGGQVMKHECPAEDADFISRLALNHHLPISTVNVMQNDGTFSSIVLYRDCDKKLFETVLKDYRHAMGIGLAEMSTEQFFNRYKEQDVNTIDKLSPEELESFRNNAVEIPFDYSVMKNEDGTYKILCPASHEEIAEKVLKTALYDMTDESKKKEMEKIVASKDQVISAYETGKPSIYADSDHPNHVFIVHDSHIEEFNIQSGNPVQLQKMNDMEVKNGADVVTKVMWLKDPVMINFDEYPFLQLENGKVSLIPEYNDLNNFNNELSILTEKCSKETKLRFNSDVQEKIISYTLDQNQTAAFKNEISNNLEISGKFVFGRDGSVAVKEKDIYYMESFLQTSVYKDMPAYERINTRMTIENRISKEMILAKGTQESMFICDASKLGATQTGIIVSPDRLQIIHNGQMKKEVLQKDDPQEYDRILFDMVNAFEEPVAMTENERKSELSESIAHNIIPKYQNEVNPSDAVKQYKEKILIEKENCELPEVIERYEKIERNSYKAGIDSGRGWKVEQADKTQKEIWKRQKR